MSKTSLSMCSDKLNRNSSKINASFEKSLSICASVGGIANNIDATSYSNGEC